MSLKMYIQRKMDRLTFCLSKEVLSTVHLLRNLGSIRRRIPVLNIFGKIAMKRDLIYLGILLMILPEACSLQCPSCARIHCYPKEASELRCKGGVTTGICGCCPTCAKVLGESCGGDFNYLGKCDRGLYCQLNKNKFSDRKPEGSCIKVPLHIQDAPVDSPRCRPKCSLDFCRLRPKAVCSATDVAEFPQHCQSPCQHTSCLACKFVQEPNCRKCRNDDFRCLKKYGKCIKRQYCTRQKFPCRRKFSNLNSLNGKFQCRVPSCL